MAKYKITHKKSECIGCGSCAAICEKYFKMNDEGVAELIGHTKEGDLEVLETDDIDEAVDAAECCPVECIEIYEDGKKIVPKE